MIQHYLITDPSFYSSNPQIFPQKLSSVLATCKPDFICLRDKQTSDYKQLAYAFTSFQTTAKCLLHSDFTLAKELGFYGVHLDSKSFAAIEKAKSLGLFVVIATHTMKEVMMAEKQGADAITFSPIYATPNKGLPKGLEKLKEINDTISIKCFALGGIITKEQIQACEEAGSYGFASIRYFLKKVCNV
ncbi:MAG: thiamine phosphate synthase [Sulfurospirillum sp.]|nr:thiamine phosphate synthase [Sulfurospirillum sp.]